MALVSSGWWLTVSLADNGANVSTLRYDLQAVDAVAAAADVSVVIAALLLVTNSIITSYAYGERFEEDAVVYPVAGIENEDKASVTALLDTGGGKKANFKIPAPKIDIFLATTGPSANIVNVSDAEMAAYGALFNAGQECYISDGETIDSLLSGKRTSAKNNNG